MCRMDTIRTLGHLWPIPGSQEFAVAEKNGGSCVFWGCFVWWLSAVVLIRIFVMRVVWFCCMKLLVPSMDRYKHFIWIGENLKKNVYVLLLFEVCKVSRFNMFNKWYITKNSFAFLWSQWVNDQSKLLYESFQQIKF